MVGRAIKMFLFYVGLIPRWKKSTTNFLINHLLFITADGNTSVAAGMSIREFAILFAAFNCESAFNLDGGDSSTMWIKEKPFNGIVNYPSDNKKFDHHGERAVANALVIMVKQ